MLSFFSALNSISPLLPETQAALMKSMQMKELRRGQVWLQEGAVCDKMSFVVKGLFKLFFETGTKEVIIQFTKENGFVLSAKSYHHQEPSPYCIRAVEPGVIISIPKNDWQFLLQRHSELYVHLLSISQQQEAAFEQHTALLLLPPKERFEQLNIQIPWLTDGKRITDKLLAGYLGVRASTVCEWRKRKRL